MSSVSSNLLFAKRHSREREILSWLLVFSLLAVSLPAPFAFAQEGGDETQSSESAPPPPEETPPAEDTNIANDVSSSTEEIDLRTDIATSSTEGLPCPGEGCDGAGNLIVENQNDATVENDP